MVVWVGACVGLNASCSAGGRLLKEEVILTSDVMTSVTVVPLTSDTKVRLS